MLRTLHLSSRIPPQCEMQSDQICYCLIASTSIEIATSSPTITPPASIALFHVRPKSLRLIFVVAEAPACVLPIIETGAPDDSTSSTTGLVTPCSVKSPVTFHLFGPPASTLVDLNVIVGYLATSRKSGLFKCMSRRSTRVSTDDASIVASTTADAGSLPVVAIVPEVFWNCPFTFEIIMCRTLNSTLVCAGSICQVSACARTGSAIVIAIAIAAFEIQDFIGGLLRLGG